jgi:hypothetical protein
MLEDLLMEINGQMTSINRGTACARRVKGSGGSRFRNLG